MADEMMNTDKNSILFTQLILSFHASAMQQMGKIKNPFTDTIERNLSQAQMSIDMLAMLQERTKGNVTEEESRYLEHVLYELRMNYVDEINKDKKGEKEQEEGTEGEAEVEKESLEEKEQEARTEGEKAAEGKETIETDTVSVKKKEKKERQRPQPSPKAKKKKAGSKKKKS